MKNIRKLEAGKCFSFLKREDVDFKDKALLCSFDKL